MCMKVPQSPDTLLEMPGEGSARCFCRRNDKALHCIRWTSWNTCSLEAWGEAPRACGFVCCGQRLRGPDSFLYISLRWKWTDDLLALSRLFEFFPDLFLEMQRWHSQCGDNDLWIYRQVLDPQSSLPSGFFDAMLLEFVSSWKSRISCTPSDKRV